MMNVYLPDKHPVHKDSQHQTFTVAASHHLTYDPEEGRLNLEVAVTVSDPKGNVLNEAVLTEEPGQSFVLDGVTYLRLLSSRWQYSDDGVVFSSLAACLEQLFARHVTAACPDIEVTDIREAKGNKQVATKSC